MGQNRGAELKLIRTTQDFVLWRSQAQGSVGFVPTMGNLHAGHLSLLNSSLTEHPVSVLSIFVNPTQFTEASDYNRYPRTLESDCALAQGLLNQHPGRQLVIWAPANPEEIYPPGFSTTVSVPGLDGFLEGEFRPGHFTGMATVVYLLLHTVRPQTAYFGRKDYQQYRIVKRMARDLGLPVRIKGLPIVRDDHGLALSSRNQFLSLEERTHALQLYRTLDEMRRLLGGDAKRAQLARDWARHEMQRDPRWQYLEVREARTLGLELPAKGKAVFLGLLKVGSVRLLDNLEGELA